LLRGHAPGPIRLTAVVGSVTPPGRLRRAVAEALDRTVAAGLATVELIDLADTRIAFADGRPLASLTDDTPAVVGAIEQADAVMLATPVYRGSLTGALKNLLDQVPVPALHGTPTAIVAMGGSDHH
jgi:NAD(P)H-dependent FMN reductase